LEGECTVTSVAEIKELLVAGLATGSGLQVDLERAEEIDITILQLLWAAEREAAQTQVRFAVQASEQARAAARAAGFERFPGEGA